MKFRIFFLCVFFQLYFRKIGSTFNNADDRSIEHTVVYLKDKITRMEERMSSFELSLAVQDSQKGFLEDKIEILKKVSDVEMRCAEVSARLQEAEVRFLKTDTHLLVTIQKVQESSKEAIDRVHTVEQELASALDWKRGISQAELNETLKMINSFAASQRDNENVIRENISSSVEKLRHLNDSLSSRFEGLAVKMRIFENTLMDIEKDYANISFVSKLDKSFQNLDKLVKTDIQPVQSERVKQLEERCALCNDVADLNKTLRSHSSKIADLLDIQNSCSDPPIVVNGYPLLSNRTYPQIKNGATITYACRGNRTLFGSGHIVCRSGVWTGDLPECMNSCNTEDLKVYDGLEIPMNKITEHSKSLDIRCRGGYVISSTSKSLTCLNGTWIVRNNPCTKESCEGEPPAVRHARTVTFERNAGSKVVYECAENYFPTRISTVHCENRNWEGEPPVCNFFDSRFYLMTWTGWDWYYCYSADNTQKIEFSRVLDTGTGQYLPGGFKRHPSTGYADFRLGKDANERGGPFGVFQCGYSDEQGFMNVVVPRQDVSSGLYFLDPFETANIGDTVELKVIFNKGNMIRWKHNGVDLPSWNDRENIEIQDVKPTDAGIYECYYEGKRGKTASALLRLIVRKCKKNMFGENCDQQCPPCYNGGICHDQLGICVCPPGFIGNNCETACGKRRHGSDCSRNCHYEQCNTELFCMPDPYGCSCAPGRKGFKCNEPCAPGWYGANCNQPCHCAGGPRNCDAFTGACSGGCSSGWTGSSCQVQGR